MLTLAEAATRLGLSSSTLRHQAHAGRLQATLYGKTYVITEVELERYRRDQLGKPGRPSHRSAPVGEQAARSSRHHVRDAGQP
ncbi:MAG TPA: helix-turn-helix domain-containing protein [Candidatus Limnocylindrales bacterium]|nr:helix-turn-helix domain-containing protein [Candidatus Limnocylindrales bacterium]